jgi:hypothetical protein
MAWCPMSGGLGRRIPETWEHVEKYPLRTLVADPAHALFIPPAGTEKSLGLPWWWKQHDQGQEGSCVGFGCSSMMSITNHYERLLETGRDITFRYAARWLYLEAQLVDEWSETPPAEGSSVKAGCDILRTVGHRRVQSGVAGDPNLANGITANRWAQSVDEIRAAIFAGLAVAIGINWYRNFSTPKLINGEWWIGQGPLGPLDGGHCTSFFRFSDRREAFRMMNNWNNSYPPVWVPYALIEDRLIPEQGEFAVITDR